MRRSDVRATLLPMTEQSEQYGQLLRDLRDERGVLGALLPTLADEVWDRQSPAEGWLLRDCVVHLAETDESAAAIAGESALAARRGEGRGVLTAGMLRGREMRPAQVLAWWRAAGERMMAALESYAGSERLTWAGRPMSVVSFTTARLMEHWSHGLDVLDAAGVAAVDTDRLESIAHLGYITRDFAYRTHGLAPPAEALYVELRSPSGQTWSWGPAEATDRVFGSAGDFCRVVTQRIHVSDTSLRWEGENAREFLSLAQTFAGPPGKGRAPKGK